MDIWPPKSEPMLTEIDDNCYSEASARYSDVDIMPKESPSGRFANMSNALASVTRPILFAICEWGVDFPSARAPNLGNSRRIANDIANGWSSIFRILN
jgi:alpha-galactosidase